MKIWFGADPHLLTEIRRPLAFKKRYMESRCDILNHNRYVCSDQPILYIKTRLFGAKCGCHRWHHSAVHSIIYTDYPAVPASLESVSMYDKLCGYAANCSPSCHNLSRGPPSNSEIPVYRKLGTPYANTFRLQPPGIMPKGIICISTSNMIWLHKFLYLRKPFYLQIS